MSKHPSNFDHHKKCFETLTLHYKVNVIATYAYPTEGYMRATTIEAGSKIEFK